jgi:hypothetical protein
MKENKEGFVRSLLICLVASLMLVYASCGDDDGTRICEPGSTQDCSCGGGRTGYQICEYTGTAWGACNCDCTPNCAGRECGSDGCGGSCGTCSGGDVCTTGGACVSTAPDCPADRDCTGRECGPDPVCGVSCGSCSGSETCEGGLCVPPTNPCSSADSCFTCVIRSGCGWCASASYCVSLSVPCSDMRTDVDSCSGGSTWDSAECSSRGGYWAPMNIDGSGGGNGCWFAATSGSQSCTAVCSTKGLTCDSRNWDDDRSQSICRHLFPSAVSAYRNNPEGGQNSPKWITLYGSSNGCVDRCTPGETGEACGPTYPSTTQDCSAIGGRDPSGEGGDVARRICVCKP